VAGVFDFGVLDDVVLAVAELTLIAGGIEGFSTARAFYPEDGPTVIVLGN